MAMPDGLKPLFEWIDVYGQSFCVNIVYRWELVCLPVVACLLVAVRRKNICWKVIFWVLAIPVLVYLLLYRMHWYSRIAYPIMVLPFCLLLLRWRWYWVLGCLSHPAGLLLPLWERARQAGGPTARRLYEIGCGIPFYVRHPVTAWQNFLLAVRPASPQTRRTWLGGGAMVVGIGLLVHFLGLPLDLALPLLIVACCVAATGFVMVHVGNCEREFKRYLKSDPRMRLYLDAVRRIRAKGRHEAGAFLWSNRLQDPDLPASGVNRWTILFRISLLPGIRWVLMILARRDWMPTTDSAFVVQHLEYARQETWHTYASARYGRFGDEPKEEDPLDAYLNRIEKHGGLPHPPEFNDRGLRQRRVSWLAMTEALAECQVFSEGPAGRETQTALNLLRAAELLGQAGEVQSQVTRDLIRYQQKRQESSLNEEQYREIRLTLHFLDLAARCLERWLAPGEQDGAANLGLRERYKRFCDEPLDNKRFKGTLLEWRLREILLARYALMARLARLLPEGSEEKRRLADETVAGADGRPGPELEGKEPDPRLALETAMAHLAGASAFAATYVTRDEGNGIRVWWARRVPAKQAAVPLLAILGARIGQAIDEAKRCGEPEYRAKNGGRHVEQLMGLAAEQETDNQRPGSDVWLDRCRLAAGFYCSCGSSRIRLIWAAARATARKRPGETPGQGRNRPDDIVTLG